VVALWTENRKGRIFLMALLKTGKYSWMWYPCHSMHWTTENYAISNVQSKPYSLLTTNKLKTHPHLMVFFFLPWKWYYPEYYATHGHVSDSNRLPKKEMYTGHQRLPYDMGITKHRELWVSLTFFKPSAPSYFPLPKSELA
jgi:hypothetical protein